MDRSRPGDDQADAQAGQVGVVMMTLFDVDRGNGLTMSMRRQRIELAGTTIGAIAVDKFLAHDGPARSHGASPALSLGRGQHSSFCYCSTGRSPALPRASEGSCVCAQEPHQNS